MDLSAKEVSGIVGWGVSIGGIIAWVKIRIKDHGTSLGKQDARLTKIEADNSRLAKIEDHDARLTKVENRFFTENGEPSLLSFRAHNHICDQKSKLLEQQFKPVVDALVLNSAATKELSDQVAKLSIGVAVLEEKMEKR